LDFLELIIYLFLIWFAGRDIQRNIVQCMIFVVHVKMGKSWTVLLAPHLWRYLGFFFFFLIFNFKNLDAAFCYSSWICQYVLLLLLFFFFLFIYQPDDLLSQKIQSLCPTITGNVCCSEAQFETLRSQVQQVRRLSGNKIEYMCTCLRSFLSVLFMFCRQFHFWSAVLHVWETFWICSVSLPVPRIRACLLTWLLRIRFAVPTVLVGFLKRF
jgi:hypothetical protein